MNMKAVKLAVRVLVCLLVLAALGHWIEAVWVTRVAAVAMAGILVTAGVVFMWTDWGDKPEPPRYHIVWHGSCNNEGGPLGAKPYRLRRTPRMYQGPHHDQG